MGTEEKLQTLEGLSELFPFYRCPKCKDRGKQTLFYNVLTTCPVTIDNPSKTFFGESSDEERDEPTNVQIHCDNCHTTSPLPDGWKWRIR